MEKRRQVRRTEARKKAWDKIRKSPVTRSPPRHERRKMMLLAASGSNLPA